MAVPPPYSISYLVPRISLWMRDWWPVTRVSCWASSPASTLLCIRPSTSSVAHLPSLATHRGSADPKGEARRNTHHARRTSLLRSNASTHTSFQPRSIL